MNPMPDRALTDAGSARLDPRPDCALRCSAPSVATLAGKRPCSVSRKGSPLTTSQAFRIVRAAMMAGRYAHAKQFKRMNRQIKFLRIRVFEAG